MCNKRPPCSVSTGGDLAAKKGKKMWSYYGAKTNIIKLYPKPLYNKIIEPFCGTARYALQHWESDVLLVDKYHVITDIWKYLQQCSPADILGLPRFEKGQNINHHTYDCDAQRYLVGFLVGFGFADPRKTASPRMRNRPNAMNYTINKIAKSLFKIRHWEIRSGSYEEIPNETATWFIDPPYQFGGHVYKMSNKKINYSQLASWCQNRGGQVIVCENTRATWLPFLPMTSQNVLSGRNFEAIYSNVPTAFDFQQTNLFA